MLLQRARRSTLADSILGHAPSDRAKRLVDSTWTMVSIGRLTGVSDPVLTPSFRPDHCDGTFDQFCDDRRSYKNITAILDSFGATDLVTTMSTYWKDYQGHDSNLWSHEWSKHGTCVSTLDPSCYGPSTAPQTEVLDYFRTAVAVFQQRPSYAWLRDADIVPSAVTTYDLAAIQDALQAQHGVPVTLRCRNAALQEIWYHFDVKGPVQSGTFIATDPDGTKGNCPAESIKYLPKTSVGEPTGTKTSRLPAPTGVEPGTPFEGRGTVAVLVDGDEQGCLISDGSWFVSGTCATYTARRTDDGRVRLSSRKGNCGVAGEDGVFKCGHWIKDGTAFGFNESALTHGEDGVFYAGQVPRRHKKEQISAARGDAEDVEVKLVWQ